MRKGLLVFGLVLGVVGVAVVALPFGRPPVSGIEKLESTDMTVPCKRTARRRLAGGGLFLACGIAVAVVALRRPRDPEPVVDDPA